MRAHNTYHWTQNFNSCYCHRQKLEEWIRLGYIYDLCNFHMCVFVVFPYYFLFPFPFYTMKPFFSTLKEIITSFPPPAANRYFPWFKKDGWACEVLSVYEDWILSNPSFLTNKIWGPFFPSFQTWYSNMFSSVSTISNKGMIPFISKHRYLS